jgi:hypothetical protein
MNCELNPLTWEKFEKMHRAAWNNGWCYGPAFTELYLDYLENWNCFKSYLDCLISNIKGNDFTLNLLIGEAPPAWKGTNNPKERSYFYNPKHSKKTDWLDQPFAYFHKLKQPMLWKEIKGKYSLSVPQPTKQEKLNFLSETGVLLIDIFPFPIKQQTEVRKEITSRFSHHVILYFIQHVQKIKEYIACKIQIDAAKIQICCGLMAPEYTSLQLMYDPKITSYLNELEVSPLQILDSENNPINIAKIATVDFVGSGAGFLPKAHEKSIFLKKFTAEKKIIRIENSLLDNIPILIDGRTPKFVDFFNSSEEKLKEKFGIKTK